MRIRGKDGGDMSRDTFVLNLGISAQLRRSDFYC